MSKRTDAIWRLREALDDAGILPLGAYLPGLENLWDSEREVSARVSQLVRSGGATTQTILQTASLVEAIGRLFKEREQWKKGVQPSEGGAPRSEEQVDLWEWNAADQTSLASEST